MNCFLSQVFYLNCIRILLQNGANPNCSYRSNLTPLHVLIFTVSENFTVSVNCDIQKRANFDFIKNILLLLLQHGLDSNLTSQHILQSVVEMVQNVRTVVTDISCIFELTLTLLQYGADPNICLTNNNSLSTSDTMRNSFRNNARNCLLFYYVMLITRKEFVLTDPDRNYAKIIMIFYSSMRHDLLFNCLRSLHNLFVVQVPNKATEHLINLISQLYRKPRSLKQLCRVTIYESLNKKIAQNINRLNMPLPIKDYVLNFEQ